MLVLSYARRASLALGLAVGLPRARTILSLQTPLPRGDGDSILGVGRGRNGGNGGNGGNAGNALVHRDGQAQGRATALGQPVRRMSGA